MIYLEYVLEIESIAKFAVSINYILNVFLKSESSSRFIYPFSTDLGQHVLECC